MSDITSLGGIPLYLVAMFLFLFSGQGHVFIFLTLGLILIYAIASSIRWFWFKKRPDKQKYKNWLQRIDASAFPSLHSARAAFLAAAVFWYYQNLSLLLILLVAVFGVGYTRVYLNRHDWKDVIGGYVVGAAVFLLLGLL